MHQGLALVVVSAGVLALSSPGLAELAPGAIAGIILGHLPQRYPLVVYVADKLPPLPSADRPAARLDQRDRRFWPPLLATEVGTAVGFRNSDPFKHNIFSPDGERYNLGTWEQGRSREYVFRREGVYRQLCNIHPEMEGLVLVLPNRAFSVVDKAGRFTIAGIPPGLRTLGVLDTSSRPDEPGRTIRVQVAPASTVSVRIEFPG